jgi:EPS-associated MarR family transcriptional regulator
MTTRLRKQQEDTNYRILRLLEENPNLSQRDLAKALGLSLGGLNYCLQALLDKGVVKMYNFQNSQRKAAYAYLLTPSGIAEKAALTGRFLKRKMEEYEALKAEIESLQTEAQRTELGNATVSPPAATQCPITTDAQLLSVLAQFPYVVQAIVFGSVAQGTARAESDLDIAVAAKHVLTQAQKMEIMAALAQAAGRPVDLIDLSVVTEPLLGQILRHGRRLLGDDAAYAGLISRHVMEQADFVPYRNRVLAERRAAWTG